MSFCFVAVGLEWLVAMEFLWLCGWTCLWACVCVFVYDLTHVFTGLIFWVWEISTMCFFFFFFIKYIWCFYEEEKKEKEWRRKRCIWCDFALTMDPMYVGLITKMPWKLSFGNWKYLKCVFNFHNSSLKNQRIEW